MKKPILVAALALCACLTTHSQPTANLFQKVNHLTRDFSRVSSKYESLKLNTRGLRNLFIQSPDHLELQLPFENGLLNLQLDKTTITSSNFSVIEALPGGARRTVDYNGGIYYRGKIEGRQNSFATISLFDDQVMGIIADNRSNIVLGAIETNGVAGNEYTLYRESSLAIHDPFSCSTSDIPLNGASIPQNDTQSANRVTTVGEPVDIYFECDNRFYLDKGSNTTSVVNYVLGFFNSTAQIYANENIKIQVSQILVWTTQDPEAAAGANSTSTVLTSFSGRMATATYVGDYAHFLSTRSLGGGVAYLLSDPCATPKQYKTGVSAIYNTYNDFPTYSWTVEVVTHELGHNLGSAHTQWCGWVGGAIDNCYTTEGGCAPGPAPTNGGTIMSYCHLTGYGINFNNGFGTQPGNAIRTVVGGATCFGTCRMTISLAKVDASCGQNNGSATVTATNGTGTISYLWSNGQTGATLNNAAPGTYNVKVNDAAGCQVLDVVTLVNSGSSLSATLTPSSASSFCTGSNALLTVTYNASYTYQWYKDAVLIPGAIANTYTASSTGNYSVTVNSGVCSVTKSVQITEVPVPSATITAGGATTFCSGGSVALNATTGTGYTYQWYKNASAISGATSSSYTTTTSGSYTVVVSGGTCQSTSSATVVTANTTPSAVITAGGATNFCLPGNVSLNASTGSGYTYQWFNNGSPISGATSSSYVAGSSGSYLVGVSASGCSAASSAVTVNANTTPIATITTGGATTFCSGGSVALNANTGSGYTYQWYKNASAISGATSSSYSATTNGSYTVVVSGGTCQSTSSAIVVTVNTTPSATITASGATTFCLPGSVTLNANTGSGYTYQWYNNTSVISGATSSSYVSSSNGSYTVIVSTSGCSATSSGITVTANPAPTATITAGGPTTFCSGNSVSLSANTGAGYTYQWYNNASAISGATNPAYNATTSGSYTVIISGGTCQSTSPATVVTVNTMPSAIITAGGATTFCAGGSVVLNASTGAGYTYQWYNNGSAISAAVNATYTATTTANYTVMVSLGSCQATSSAVSVSAVALPVATITAAGPTTFCSGGSVILNASTGYGYSYQWYNNGSVIGGATNSSYTATTASNYTVSVSAGSCQALSSAVSITVNPTPSASIIAGGPTTFCAGSSVTLTANAGSGYTYQWYNNSSVITGATGSSYAATSTGNYTVTVNSGSCGNLSALVAVNSVPLPTASVSASGPTTFCSGGAVTLNASTGSGYTYQWYNNGVAITGAVLSSYPAISSGNYSVKTTAGSCEAISSAITITVNPTPAAAISSGGSTTICSGGNVVLSANTGAGLTYQWYFNGNTIPGASGTSYPANSTGNYTVTVTSGSCSNNSSSVPVTVNPLPSAVITPGGPTIVCTGSTVTLNASSGSGYNYDWYRNTVLVNSSSNNNYQASVSGDYTVRATSNGCTATSAPLTIAINPAPQAAISASGNTGFCTGGNVTLSATTGAGYSFQWYKNGTLLNGATNNSFSATGAGDYSVKIDLGACSSTSSATTITVFSNPSVTLSPVSSTIQKFQTQSLVAAGAVTYNWSAQPALVSAIGGSAVFKPLTTTNYLVEGTDANGCKSNAAATITVIGCGDVTGIISAVNSPSRVNINWNNPQDVNADTLQYRKAGSIPWTRLYVSGQHYEINGLAPNTAYEYNIVPVCTTSTVFLPSTNKNFTTMSMGSGVYAWLYPNPVNTTAKLEIILDKPYTLQVTIWNNMGQVVQTLGGAEHFPAGQVIKLIDPATLLPGIYQVSIMIDNNKYNLKMMVSK